MYDYGNWLFVLLNVIIFLYFIKSAFQPQTKTDWETYRWIGAFIVALFAEMYGFPLTILLLTSYFGNRLNIDFSHNSGHLLNTLLGIKGDPHVDLLHILSNVLIIGGIILIGSAWKILYKAYRENTLARTGPYRYIRHPQYLGFVLLIAGFLLQWPTLITLAMAPILIFRYIRLSLSEEKAMIQKYGKDYIQYQHAVPRFCPSVTLLLVDVKQKFMKATNV